MDGNSWRPAQGDPNMDPNDWRTQLTLDSRQRIVNEIMETLKRHLPISGPEGIVELKKIAVRFEEKIYTAAISQPDYLRKISLKMLAMETKSQSNVLNSLPSNSAAGNQNQPDPASHNIQSQVCNARQSLPTSMPDQSQSRQQHVTQSLQNSISSSSMQSSNLPPALSSITGLTQTSISNGIGQSSGLQNMGPISQNAVNNSLGQARQQVSPQQHQLQNPQNQFVYQQQLQHQLLKQKLQQSSLISQPHLQQQQQQQQPLLQSNQMQQTSPQSLMSQNSGLQSSQTTLQQAQPSVMLPAQQSGIQQNQQCVLRQQQQAQQSTAHQQPSVLQQQTQIGQQQILTSQQQQQLIGQHGNATNMQQNHLLGQHNSIPDIQQQQQQQQQQQLLGQQQQQLGQQNNISSQQLLGQQPGISNIQQHQNLIQQLLQAKAATQQAPSTLLPPQGQQSQPQPSQQQQLMSQLQSQPVQLQQQIALQQQQSNQLSRDLQQRLQASGGLLQPQNVMDQQKHMFQAQRGRPEASSTSMDSTAQTGHSTPVDWQEETYQKMKSLKDTYFLEINELYQKIALKCLQQDNPGQAQMAPMQSDHLEKLKYYKNYLERIIQYLQAPKNNISLNTKDRIGGVEKQIVAILTMFKRKPNSSQQQQQQGQQEFLSPGGQTLSMQQQQQLQNQISQMQQQHDNHHNQMQQGSVTSAMTMQHGSMPLSSHIGVQTTQPGMMTGSNSEPTQGSDLSSLQQGAMGSLQQNTFYPPQQSNMNMLSQNLLQSNIGPLQQQHMNQQQEQHQHLQKQLKQQFQLRQIQQLMQQQHKQQQFQQHLLRQQQSAQLQAHQMQQFHQINEANEMEVKLGTVLKSGLFQHPVNQRPLYHQQLKPGTTFPVSSPQLLQTTSPQISQHLSPQIDQQSLLTASVPKTGTPLQPANSTIIVPSPSTPLAPSPIPGDPEKQTSGLSSLSSAGNIGHQQTPVALTQAQSLAIGTPGISASPLLEQCTGQDGNQGTGSTLFSGNKSNAAEWPLDHLIKVASPTIGMLVRAHTIRHRRLEIENKSLRDKLRSLKTAIVIFVFLYFLWFFI